MCSKATLLRLTAAISTGLLLLAGCGKKGDPLPPLLTIPLPTSDLNVRQQGSWLLLEMSYPKTTVSGTVLGEIDGVELLQMVKPLPPGGEPTPVEPREMAAAGEVLMTLRGAELDAAITGDRIQFRLPLADDAPGEPAANLFAVRTLRGEEASAISNVAALVPIAPPEAPRALAAEPRADGVELRWEFDAGATRGFDVYRRDAQLRGYGEPLARVGGDERGYLDRGARYGQRYIYTVRTVANEKPLIQSAEAGEVEIDYQDRFAPPLPRNFVALAETRSIRLRWDPSAATDVAGYHLYRREPGRDFHRITEDPIAGEEYLDTGLTGGFSYSYRIQAVDREGNESELSEPVTNTVR